MVIYCSTWIWATYYIQAIRRWNLPTVIWTPASPHGWNLNSLAVLGGTLRQWEIPFRHDHRKAGQREDAA